MSESGKWRTLRSPKTLRSLSPAPIQIGSSLWIVNSHRIIEYHLDTNSVGAIFHHPRSFRNGISTCLCRNNNSILITNGERCNIFDSKTRNFSDTISFPEKIGPGQLCVAIGDYIHIFHGLRNPDGLYIIYSSINHTVRTFKGHCCIESNFNRHVLGRGIIKMNDCYQSSNKMLISGFARKQNDKPIPSVIVELILKFSIFELFKLAGCNSNDSFCIGTVQNGNGAKPIQWKRAPEYNLKHPMHRPGYIQHGPFIVTFGGLARVRDIPHSIDDIYILDLRKNCGWIQSPIKCPKRGEYRAVLDETQRVHLLSFWYDHELYCIKLSDVIPSSMY